MTLSRTWEPIPVDKTSAKRPAEPSNLQGPSLVRQRLAQSMSSTSYGINKYPEPNPGCQELSPPVCNSLSLQAPAHGLRELPCLSRAREDASAALVNFYLARSSGVILPASCTGQENCTPAAQPLMEQRGDNKAADIIDTIHLYAVFDGHGGSEVAAQCAQHLPSHLGSALRENESHRTKDPQHWLHQACDAAFQRTDADVCKLPCAVSCGSTALVALLSEEWFCVASCGEFKPND